jgi:hypothetical protein
VNSSAELVALVPLGVVTVTFTVPADPAGDVAVIDVEEFTVTAVAVTAPNITVAPGTKPVPVIAMEVPPVAVPLVGLMEVIVGMLLDDT